MVPLLILLLVLVLVVFPIWALIKILSLSRRNEELEQRFGQLQWEFRTLRDESRAAPPAASPAPAPIPFVPPVAPPAAASPALPPILATPPPPVPAQPVAPVPVPSVAAASASVAAADPAPPLEAPPPLEPSPPGSSPWEEKPSLASRINWEHFMGARLFLWLGGLAAFLGAVFFVKYSFEHDLIPPEVRVALGFLLALGLLVGGLKLDRERYRAQAETLCGTGIVILYAVTFACNSIYHFAFFGPLPTFLLMALITATAFLLAARLDARVVAILGILGGFLTPVLLSTGRDNPPGLFGYISLLDLGLIAVALNRRWPFLVALGAMGTIAMQIGWAEKFLSAAKAPTAMVVTLVFCTLFLGADLVARRLDRHFTAFRWSAIAFPLVALGFALVFLGYAAVAARPGLLFGFVLLADACLLALTWIDEEVPKLHLVGGAMVFLLLAIWTSTRLTSELLPWALALYLLHAVLHTGFPLLLERHRPDTAPSWWSQLFPPLALVLMFLPLVKLEAISLIFWPCVLLIDLMAIGLAVVTGTIAGVVLVLLLTLGVTAAWIFQVPTAVTVSTAALVVIGGFALLFFGAGLGLARRFGQDQNGSPGSNWLRGAQAQLPAFAALLPFLLLILMTQRLALPNPSPVFGLALLLITLTGGLTVLLAPSIEKAGASDSATDGPVSEGRHLGIEWLPACALAGTTALEFAWMNRHPTATEPTNALTWFVLFHVVFAGFPFVFRARFASMTGPWAVAALSGVTQFTLVYQLVRQTWPNDVMGLLPGLFALPPLLSLGIILKLTAANAGTSPAPAPGAAGATARLNQLAWFGGVALLFITLVFPLQFSRQWLTLGWALEGVALLWLYHRVPHRGLRLTGVVLLLAAFLRLAVNPAVLQYHARSEVPLLNWYLYGYGLATCCLLAGARLLSRPDPVDGSVASASAGVTAPALLNTLGVVLAFLLLNLEIADYFTPPGAPVLTFQFSGNFAQDMTYTIAWALFALALLLVGIWKSVRAGRVAALGLLGCALLKLFLHDLARLEALYRIGALFGVAVVAIVASFAYQRFLPGIAKNVPHRP